MDKAAIVYWSGTGNTEAMAKAIARGMKSGGVEADVFEVSAAKVDVISEYSKIAFGCPSMGDEVLEECDFEPFFCDIEEKLEGKKVALFGSYGWGSGQWMRDWVRHTREVGADLYDEGLIMKEAPNESECETYGKQFAAF